MYACKNEAGFLQKFNPHHGHLRVALFPKLEYQLLSMKVEVEM